MVWGPTWLSRAPVALPSNRLLRLLRLRLLSMEVMLEEEVVRERARRVIPADGTESEKKRRVNIPFARRGDSPQCGSASDTQTTTTTTKVPPMQNNCQIWKLIK